MKSQSIGKRIERIVGEIGRLGPLRPGTVYVRESVCGKAGCRCSRAKNPVRHGPYHYVSYTFRGRSHTEFVPRGQLRRVRAEIRTYRRLMELVESLVACHLERARAARDES